MKKEKEVITDQELLELNRAGFIPGPSESEKQFLERIALLRSQAPSTSDWTIPSQTTQKLYDFSLDWIPVAYSNEQLRPWEGAAIWIEGIAPRIQLRKKFQKGNYLKLYHRDEVLAHEAVHAARMAFSEPRFEELLAYATSPYSWRRALGALFRAPWEAYLFVALLTLSLLAQLFQLIEPFAALLLIIAVIACGSARLFFTHLIFQRAKINLSQFSHHPSALLFRLTDKEIALIASSPTKIPAYVAAQKELSLRWRLLSLAYF